MFQTIPASFALLISNYKQRQAIKGRSLYDHCLVQEKLISCLSLRGPIGVRMLLLFWYKSRSVNIFQPTSKATMNLKSLTKTSGLSSLNTLYDSGQLSG